MPTRRMLAAIADGVVGHFVSRHSDVAGQWSIGVICELSSARNLSYWHLNLISLEQEPDEPRLAALTGSTQQLLLRLLAAHGVPLEWVQSAIISVWFVRRETDVASRPTWTGLS